MRRTTARHEPMILPPVSLARLRGALDAAGAPPRKRHGQHYLLDDNLLALITREARIGPADTVLEIGPGPGLLTRHLLAAAGSVVAIEIDGKVRLAAQELIEPELARRLRWLEGDALAGSRTLAPDVAAVLPRCSRVVSNLPYNVGAQLVMLLLTHPCCPERLVFLLQREVGERLLALAGCRDYGPLAILTSLCSRPRLVRRIAGSAFWPRPRVESVLVALDRLVVRPEATQLQELERFLPAAFHNRRKTLVNSLAGASGLTAGEVGARLGGLEKVEKGRAEAFVPVQLLDLAHCWAATAPGEPNRP